MLSVQMEQRVNLEFLVKLEKTFTEAYAMLKEVYGNACLSRTQVFEWFKRFKEGRETTEDEERQKLMKTLKKSINQSAKIVILHESFNKMVPKLLSPEQKESRMNICAGILNNIDIDPGLIDTVTLKGTRFESVEAVKAKMTEVLIRLTEADFQYCFQQQKSRMERCRDRRGEYIKGEKVATVIGNG
ncbi:hypothetical protein NQ318_014283 [Aromia moschata]|uniref:Mos1 transposase HTH domain-containing protein n=1 Tax=Aromia moschata TaxID=1265417 RepID=A0AAV8Z063_9CUCU|nr:hypothetical protein NQ318_014283 [Aromia moschata]